MARKSLGKGVAGKNQQAKRDGVEGKQLIRQTPNAAFAPDLRFLSPASESVIAAKERGMVGAIDEIITFGAMPDAHDAESKKETEIGGGVFALEPLSFSRREEEPHIDMVPKPEGEGHVPAIPEIADVFRNEREIEILRALDAEEAGEGDGKMAVAGEIEE